MFFLPKIFRKMTEYRFFCVSYKENKTKTKKNEETFLPKRFDCDPSF